MSMIFTSKCNTIINYISINTLFLNKSVNLHEIILRKFTMGEKKQKEASKGVFIFGKKNYKFMFIGLAVIALGFILMAGGDSEDPNVFNPEVFSWRRIRLAPTLVLIGFAIQVYAILLNPKTSNKED